MKTCVPGFLDTAAADLLSGRPRIVGFSTVFQQNIASLVLAKRLKELDPSLTIIFGGDNCDGPMGVALHASFPWVDIVVRGEGEHVLVALAEDLLNGRSIRPQPGLCYRERGQDVVIPQEEAPRLVMADVPAPVYDDYFERLEKSPLRSELRSQVALLFESSRGCWWGEKSHCTFCGLNHATMKFRSKPPERVLEELRGLAERYKVLDFVAVDDIIDMNHVRELLPLLRDADCDFRLFYEVKANLTRAHLQALKDAGVSRIEPGIESLSIRFSA